MEVDFGQRIKAAHQRARLLAADTARLAARTRELLHITRNTRHRVRLLRAARDSAK
jgi:hypothetical protein